MKTKDQQAQEYAEKKIQETITKCYLHPKKIQETITKCYLYDEQIYDVDDIKDAYKQAYHDGYTGAEQSMWRSVEEELPEPDTVCLVFGYQDWDFNGRFTPYTMMAWYDGEDFYDAYNDRKYHPEKWMAIPLPDKNIK